MLPSSGNSEPRSVKADLYKLNVYSGPNGKFKAHVDTPRSVSQFGSLVVALPVAHKGGELVVRSCGKEMTFDWSSDSADSKPEIKWAAFYSDYEHEVLEVTSGHRVTLTYNLYSDKPAAGLLDATSLPLYEPLKFALQTPGFLQEGKNRITFFVAGQSCSF